MSISTIFEIKMFKRPPFIDLPKLYDSMRKVGSDELSHYMKYNRPLDDKGRYLHFDEFRRRTPKGLNADIAWAVTKMARNLQLTSLISINEEAPVCKFMLTPGIQKAISEVDKNTTTAVLEWMMSNIGEREHFKYLFDDLVGDEAISSSQMEGAATTTKAAKALLRSRIKPRTPDEKMIIGNYKMMCFAWEHRAEAMSVDLILEMHKIGVEGIEDEHYHPGAFRQSDDVVVVDGDGDIVHTPPPHPGIEDRLEKLLRWVNKSHHKTTSDSYMHPLVKAIIIHFAIGYEHPFRDGNGRVARSLFYWYMFKNEYAAFRYIAISVLLKAAAIKYGKSYLYSETDEMDLTYFIDYQCSIIISAVSNYKSAYERSLKEIEKFSKWLWSSGLYNKLSERQRLIFQVAKSGLGYFTISNTSENLGCSRNTAAAALNGCGFFL